MLIIGAGQAELATAYWLQRLGVSGIQVVDAAPIGDSWRTRSDILRLFTPRRFSGLPGLPFTTGHAVRQLTRTRRGFLARTDMARYTARQVVVATGPFARPYRPTAASSLGPAVAQLHSADYDRPGDVPAGEVVVVGGGNSAAQLAIELAEHHAVTVVSPRPPWFLPERVLGIDLYWWLYLTGTLNATADARVSRYVRRRGDAIVGTQLCRAQPRQPQLDPAAATPGRSRHPASSGFEPSPPPRAPAHGGNAGERYSSSGR